MIFFNYKFKPFKFTFMNRLMLLFYSIYFRKYKFNLSILNYSITFLTSAFLVETFFTVFFSFISLVCKIKLIIRIRDITHGTVAQNWEQGHNEKYLFSMGFNKNSKIFSQVNFNVTVIIRPHFILQFN